MVREIQASYIGSSSYRQRRRDSALARISFFQRSVQTTQRKICWLNPCYCILKRDLLEKDTMQSGTFKLLEGVVFLLRKSVLPG